MLYEVITAKGFWGRRKNCVRTAKDAVAKAVITSYSIHYTKLYEWLLQAAKSQGHRQVKKSQ